MNIFEMQENNVELNSRQQKFIDNYNFFDNIDEIEEKYCFSSEHVSRKEQIDDAWHWWENGKDFY